MAAIALVTANRVSVVESILQLTAVAAAAITAGQPVRLDSNGKFIVAEGDSTTTNDVYGVATRTVPIGMPVTAVRIGVLDGFVLDALAYGARVYINDSGALDTAAGTAAMVVGRVIPGASVTLGTANDKLLMVQPVNT